MKKLLLSILLLTSISFLVASCHCKKKAAADTVTPEVKRDFEAEGYVKAMVIYYDLDACRYLLVLTNEKKLEPSAELPTAFQNDKLTVWLKYAPKKGGVSVCMAGQMVDIADIQIRK